MSLFFHRELTPDDKRIRLINLLPSVSAESLPGSEAAVTPKCTIYHTPLDQPPPYYALSYAWGDRKSLTPILVDGKPFEVTANLHSALVHLTPKTDPVPLWIDALCIDQKNEVEKSEQVAQMREIYLRAKSVITWLGPASDNSDAAMRWIGHYGSQALDFGIGDTPDLRLNNLMHRLETDTSTLSQPGLQAFLRDVSSDLSPSSGDPNKIQWALARLFQRPYWNRVWVVQELVHAKSLQFSCGTESVPENLLHHATRLIRNHGQFLSKKASYLHQSNDSETVIPFIDTRSPVNLLKVRRTKGPYPLAYLIRLLRNSISTDPRDKIFALLSFSADVDRLSLQPDYRKSCRDVYIETTTALLRHGFTDLLSLCGLHKVIDKLPSWVPDFSADPARAHLQQRALDRGSNERITVLQPQFSASGKTDHAAPRFEPATGHMAIKSIVVGEVSTVGTPWQPQSSNRWLSELLSLSGLKSRQVEPDCLKAIWRTAIADQEARNGNQKPRLSDTLLEKVHDEFKGIVFENERQWKGDNADTKAYLFEMQRLAAGRRPFNTREGHLGIGPQDMMPSDFVHVLMGLNTPFVLRNRQDGVFQLIGEAYVHGVMDGEAVTDVGKWKILSIC